METALDTLRSIDLITDFADFDNTQKIKMIEAELEKYWQEHPVADGEGEKVDAGIEYKTEFEMRIHFTSENEISENEFVQRIGAALQDGKSYILVSPIQPLLPSAVTGGVKWVRVEKAVARLVELKPYHIMPYNLGEMAEIGQLIDKLGELILPNPSEGQPEQGGKPFMEGKDEK